MRARLLVAPMMACALALVLGGTALGAPERGERRFVRSDAGRPALPATVQRPAGLSALSASAQGGTAGLDDADDVTGALDIKRVTHSNDDARITYQAAMYENVAADQVQELGWLLEFNGDSTADACVLVRWDANARALRGTVFGTRCAGASLGTATMNAPSASTIQVRYDIAVLRAAQFSGSSYRYRVQSNAALGQTVGSIVTDKVPDDGSFGITHDLAASGGIGSGSAASSAGQSATGSGTSAVTAGAAPATAGQQQQSSTATSGAATAAPARAAGAGALPTNGARVQDLVRAAVLLVASGSMLLTVEMRLRTAGAGVLWERVVVVAAAPHARVPWQWPTQRHAGARPALRARPMLPAPLVCCALPPAVTRPALPAGRG